MIPQRATLLNVTTRSLRQEELAHAEHLFRRAFGTFLGLPDPDSFGAGLDVVTSRWTADRTRVFAAEYEGRLVGTSIASNWGSIGFFGPLTVSPELWDRGVGQALLGPVMEQFGVWGTQHLGLFTFPHSPKHLHLYEKFGFCARFLTLIMSKVTASQPHPAMQWVHYSALSADARAETLTACRALSDAVYTGLDVTCEIEAVHRQRLGDTVVLSGSVVKVRRIRYTGTHVPNHLNC